MTCRCELGEDCSKITVCTAEEWVDSALENQAGLFNCKIAELEDEMTYYVRINRGLWAALLILCLLTIAGIGTAYAYHSHIWTKQNQTVGTDPYGNSVVICGWICRDYSTGQNHYAQTQGFGYCPMP